MDSLIYVPNPILRQKAEPLDPKKLSNRTIKRLYNMFSIMGEHQGIGLAAPQIGWSVTAFVMNLSRPLTFINPKIETHGDLNTHLEGCLSIPSVRGRVERPWSVKVEAYGIDGKPFSGTFHGLESFCIQHEVEHLLGILFTDKVKNVNK